MGSLIRAFFKNSGVVALPGYSIFDTPWAGVKTNVGAMTHIQSSVRLAGGGIDLGTGQNLEFTTDYYMAAGTFMHQLIYGTYSNQGIDSVQLNGVTQGTIDQYAAAPGAENVVTTIAGLAVTAGVKTVRHLAATKNASSTDYDLRAQTQAWVRTGV